MSNQQINKQQGWISIYRSLQDNDLWTSERFTKGQAWIDLLLLANRKEKTIELRGVEIIVKRGQLAYSIVTLSKRWSWNERTVSNFLKSLNRREMIQSKTSNVSTVITICNYEDYQKTTEQSTEQSTEQTQSRVQTNNNRDKGNTINNIAEETSAMIEKTVQDIDKKQGIRHEYQYLGLELWEQLAAPLNKKGEFIRICRDYPIDVIDTARSFALDYPVKAIRWKMFFQKFWLQIKNKNDKPNGQTIISNK